MILLTPKQIVSLMEKKKRKSFMEWLNDFVASWLPPRAIDRYRQVEEIEADKKIE